MLNSDEDVLTATVATLKIFENSQLSRNKKTSHSQASDGSDNSLKSYSSAERDFLTSLSTDLKQNIPITCLKNCSQFQSAIEALEVINMMHNFYHEKKSQQAENGMLQDIMDNFSDITSPSKVRIQLEKVKTVLDHIKTISTNGAKLKQVLRSNVLNDFWRINVDYHKSVVRFFTLAQEVTRDINQLIISIEKSKEHNPDRTKNLHLLEIKLLAELHENLDILNEFRNYIQSSISSDLPKSPLVPKS